MKRTLKNASVFVAAFASLLVGAGASHGQTQTPVSAGAGSYANTLPMSGAPGDSTYYGPDFSQLESLYSTLYIAPSLKSSAIPTNHWWTDLMTSFRTGSSSGSFVQTPYSDTLWVFPYAFAPTSDGMQIYYPTGWFPRGSGGVVSGMIEGPDLQVDAVTTGGNSFNAPNPVVTSYGDWTLGYTETDTNSGASITTYLARGVPFVWANYSGANPEIMVSGNPLLDGNQNPISTTSGTFTATEFSVNIGGQIFGVYTAPGTTFNVSGNYVVPQLGSSGYVVYALLPNASYLNQFGQYAYAEVTGSQMNWTYNRPAGQIQTTWTLSTTPLYDTNTSTLQGWLPHHYHSTINNLSFLPCSYVTARGTLQIAPGSTFQIAWPFHGMAPELPAPHTNNLPNDYQASRMQQYMSTFAGGNRPEYIAETYGQGKEFGVTATYMTMADQLGMTSTKTGLLNNMETLFDNWYSFTPGKSAPYFGALPDWGAIIGLPESYGTGDFNDQHFHYGYFMTASALTGMEDPTWLQNYAPMLTLIAKEYANWDRTDTNFPFLRVFDVWEGHSWAGGFSSAGGENQESSSESMDAWVGLFLLGNMLGNQQMADAGAMGYTMESSAVNEYWQDWKHTNFPSTYGLYGSAILASQQIQYQNFFSADPFWEYAIEYIPINHWNDYLARDPYFTRANLAAILPERAYAAANNISGFSLSDANNDYSVEGNYPGDYPLAIQTFNDQNMTAREMDDYWNANLNITAPADLPGIVYYLTHTLRALGEQDSTYYTDMPTSAVYYNSSTGVRTAVIYNPHSTAQTVTIYNNGAQVAQVSAPPGQLYTTTVPGSATSLPLHPTGLYATATNGQVNLTWNSVADATSYDVYRVSSAGSYFFSGLTGTSLTDSGLTNSGTSYTYQVYAVNAAGMSQPCTPVTIQLYGTGAQTLVDPLNDFSHVSSMSPNWAIDTSNPQYFNGDGARADRSVDDTEYLDYSYPNITNFTATVYALNASTSEMLFFTSVDHGATFQPVTVNYGTESTTNGWGYYTITPAGALPANVTDLKVEFTPGSGNNWDPQLANLVLNYTGPAGGNNSGSVLPAPTGLAASPGNGQNSLTWNAVSGATSYNVYRAVTSGGEGIEPVAIRVTGTSYMSDALANGETYYYTVAAVNNAGVGPQSNEASATPSGGAPPSPATALTGTPQNHAAALSWTAGSGAATYEIFRGTSSGAEGTVPLVSGVTGTTYTDTGLTNGSTYYYYVVSANEGGVSAQSNEVSVTPNPPTEAPYGGTPWPVPGTIQAENYDTGGQGAAYNVTSVNGSANNYRSDGVDLETTSDTGGGYDMGWTNAGQWFNYTVNVATAGTYTVSFRVASPGGGTLHLADLNGDNLTGPVSVPATGGYQTWTTVTATANLNAGVQVLEVYQDTGGWNINWFALGNGSTAPPAPTGLGATAGNATVGLGWTASAGATSYNVYRGTAPGAEGATPIGTSTTATYADNTVVNGTTYYYTVAAVDGAGTSGMSNEASGTPEASNTVTDPLSNWNIISSKSANWTLDNSNPTYFNGDTSRATRTVDDTEYLIYNFSGITNFDALVYTYQGPITVATFYTSPDGNTWTQVNVNYGSESAPVSGWGSYSIVPSGSLPSGTNYLKVQFTSGTGNAWDPQLSQISITYTGTGGGGGSTTAPSAPANLAATGGNATVGLTWTASSGATSYNVYRGTAAGQENSTPIGTSTTANYTDNTVTNGTTYYYTVAAVNSNGTSGMSNEASATPSAPATEGPFGGTPWPVPGTIQAENYDTGGPGVGYNVSSINGTANNYRPDGVDLEVTSDTGGGYDLGWSAAGQWFNYTVNVATAGTYTVSFRVASDTSGGTLHLDSNGTNVTGTVTIPGTGGWQTWTTVTATATLAAGTQVLQLDQDSGQYNINWFALSGGSSSPTAPAPPANLTATAGNATVGLAWTGSTGATSYNVYRGTAAGAESSTPIGSSTTATYTDNNVVNGTTYYYTVAAVNGNGTSGPSNEANATPSGSAATTTSGSAAINCGGGAVSPYLADTDYSGGSAGSTTNAIDTTYVSQPAPPQSVLQSYRMGVFTYTLPGFAPNSSATVTLIFMDPTSTGTGQRQFNVSINGTQVLTDFDTYAATGAQNKAIQENLGATANANGQVIISFTNGNAGSPIVSVVGVNGTAGPSAPSAPSNLAATAGNATVGLTWSASTGATSYNVYRGTASGEENSTPIGTSTTATYTDNNVVNGTTYYYTVAAVNSGGTSGMSNEASATPVSPTPPTTTATIVNPIGGPATITLSVSDPNYAANTLTTYYTLDSGAQQTYSGAITVSTFGSHTISYWSVDPAGNTETANNQTFTVVPELASISATPKALLGDQVGTVTITLTGPAPAGGINVPLMSENRAAAKVSPTSVFIPAGSTTATAAVKGYPVTSNTLVTLYAKYGHSHTCSVTVLAPVVQKVEVLPSKVIGGAGIQTGTVTMSSPVAVVTTVQIASDNPDAIVPSYVLVQPGHTTATFQCKTKVVTDVETANITATGASNSASYTITIKPQTPAAVD